MVRYVVDGASVEVLSLKGPWLEIYIRHFLCSFSFSTNDPCKRCSNPTSLLHALSTQHYLFASLSLSSPPMLSLSTRLSPFSSGGSNKSSNSNFILPIQWTPNDIKITHFAPRSHHLFAILSSSEFSTLVIFWAIILYKREDPRSLTKILFKHPEIETQ